MFKLTLSKCKKFYFSVTGVEIYHDFYTNIEINYASISAYFTSYDNYDKIVKLSNYV